MALKILSKWESRIINNNNANTNEVSSITGYDVTSNASIR